MKLAPEAVADAWPHYRLRVTLDQSLLALLEDGSRWAIRNRYVERAEVPNYLNFVHTGSLAAVRAEAVTVIR
jgi:NitT/TauT family transport system substrate-binding protein